MHIDSFYKTYYSRESRIIQVLYFITKIVNQNKTSWKFEWGIAVTELIMLFGEDYRKTLELWTRKALEC